MALTANAVQCMLNGDKLDKPTLQIIALKKLVSKPKDGATTNADRQRLTISDGTHMSTSAMLGTQLNHLIESNELRPFTVVTMTKYINQVVGGRPILIVLGVDIVANPDAQIGDPKSVDREENKDGPAGTGAAPAAPPPANKTNSSTAAASATASASAGVTVKTSPHNPYQNRSYTSAASAMAAPKASGGAAGIFFIQSLHPYVSSFAIRARVTAKSAIRQWTSNKGTGSSGSLFSVDLVDQSGEIRATAFNDMATKLNDVFQVGKVYIIRNGKVKQSNPKFNQLKNDYELSLTEATEVTEDSSSDATELPMQKYYFKTFSELQAIEFSNQTGPGNNVYVDVIAVVVDVLPVATITTRDSKDVSKRDLKLKDRDSFVLRCTLWGQDAEEFENRGGQVGAIVAIRKARLSDYNGGRTLSVSAGSNLAINPDLPEAHALKGWYDEEGATTSDKLVADGGSSTKSVPIIHVADIMSLPQATVGGDNADFFAVKATLMHIKKTNATYKACPSEACGKKKLTEDAGKYHCTKCNKDFNNFDWRIMLSASFSDATGQNWFTCFQEDAENILGAKAAVLGELSGDEKRFNAILQRARCTTWHLRCKAKMESWQDQNRLRVTVLKAQPLNYVEECQRLIGVLNEYLQ